MRLADPAKFILSRGVRSGAMSSQAWPPLASMSPQMLDTVVDMPGLPPPDGEISNFVNPEYLRAPMIAAVTLGIVFSTFTVAARIYTKLLVIRSRNYEDYFVMAAWAFFMAFCANIYAAVPVAGVHMWDEHLRDVFELLQVDLFPSYLCSFD
jgi:hypothetical protein